jgi:hypothetical protein
VKHLPLFICITVALLLLSYTIIRACKLSFTHDESYTYLYSSLDSFMQIISNRTTEISANNHILNTLFMKLFDRMFGSSEISLRFQSILAHIVYLTFTFLIIRQFRSRGVQIAGFIILNINPYLLDFFSLARGYALSIAFMIVSIYYFIEYMKEEKNKQLTISFIAAAFATLSNFSLLNYFAALLFIHQMILYFKYKSLRMSFNKSKSVIVIVLLMILICYEPLRKLIKYKRFDFGGTTGIWSDTVKSEIDMFLYQKGYSPIVFTVISIIIIATVISVSIILIRKYKMNTVNIQDKICLLVLSLLTLILLSNTVQHYLFDSPYIAERFALFITPLFFLLLVYLYDFFASGPSLLKLLSIATLPVLTLFMCYHFLSCLNTTYSLNWNYDASTKEMISDLENEKKLKGLEKIELGITWWFEPTINFYKKTKELNWLEKVTREGPSGQYDYYYISSEEQTLVPIDKKVVKEYPVSASKLMK